jgi:hypothetical protein
VKRLKRLLSKSSDADDGPQRRAEFPVVILRYELSGSVSTAATGMPIPNGLRRNGRWPARMSDRQRGDAARYGRSVRIVRSATRARDLLVAATGDDPQGAGSCRLNPALYPGKGAEQPRPRRAALFRGRTRCFSALTGRSPRRSCGQACTKGRGLTASCGSTPVSAERAGDGWRH